jgi:hypothetical protein
MGIELGCKPVLSVEEIYLFREKPNSPQPCWWNTWFCVRHRMRVGSAYQEIREMSAPTTNNLHAWRLIALQLILGFSGKNMP